MSKKASEKSSKERRRRRRISSDGWLIHHYHNHHPHLTFSLIILSIILVISSQHIIVTASTSTSTLYDVFQIPDQQAYLGKLFYYQLKIPNNVHNFSLVQAGYGGSLEQAKLPEWLHFDPGSAVLFGAPLERKIYFIQVQASLGLSHQTYEDIFVIEVVELPGYLLQASTSAWPMEDIRRVQGTKATTKVQCRIELRKSFANVKEMYDSVVVPVRRSDRDGSDSDLGWMNRFTTARTPDGAYHLTYDVEECDDDAQKRLLMDGTSEKILSRLKQLAVQPEVVKIMPTTGSEDNHAETSEKDKFSTTSSEEDEIVGAKQHDHHHNHHSHNHHHHDHHHRRNHHRRRHAYGDDPYPTPTLGHVPPPVTSTVDYSNIDVLSRTLIPSMVSPTFTGGPSVMPTPTLPVGEVTRDPRLLGGVGSPPQAMYPQLYSTPVLLPNPPTLLKSLDPIHLEPLATPIFISSSPSAQPSPSESIVPSSTLEVIIPSDSVVPEVPVTTTTEGSTSSSTEHITSSPNRQPFVNRRISKLSITAGKYWQFSIPEDTFYDKEDGNTRNLKLGFYIDSEIPSSDSWIQFNPENQYLYALPTEDNIGRYRFSLGAVDSQGAEVMETLEIYVRQSRHSLTYTHKFILANITWLSDEYPERIQAVSSLLQRIAMQVFEEMGRPSSAGSNEVAQRQEILHSMSVLSITQNLDKWSITWTNDSLRRHPCPVNEVNKLFTRLYDVTYPEDEEGFMAPSIELRTALAPEFSLVKVKRQFISRSACGSYAAATDQGVSRHKDKIVFSNRLNRLGPFKLGEAFKFLIPKDTVYSVSRNIDTRQLKLSLAPVEPEVDIPEFLFFDRHEQTIYGLPYKHEHVRTYELKLIAEDPFTGGSERDVFVVDVVHDGNTREDYLFEVTMSFLLRNIEHESRSAQRLTPKDYYQIAQSIATRLMGNTNLDALRMLDITRNRYSREEEPVYYMPESNAKINEDSAMFEVPSNSVDEMLPSEGPEEVDQESSSITPSTVEKAKRSHRSHRSQHHYKRKSSNYHYNHHHYHHAHHENHAHHRNHRAKRELLRGDYFYEFIWTNRTLVTSYSHNTNAYGGGSVFETQTCPRDMLQRDIYGRLFPQSGDDFSATHLNIPGNTSQLDVLDVYAMLFDSVEANVRFMSVEWTPKSVCSHDTVLNSRIIGSKPIKELAGTEEEEEEKEAEEPVVSETPKIINIDEIDQVDQYPTPEYVGDKLLAMIIPPIAILIALLFAVTIGCCFHRANLRRKAMNAANGAQMAYHEETPNLYRQRIPIQFEFERGTRGPAGPMAGLHPSEQESMLDSKFGRHPVQIMPTKRAPPLPSQAGRGKGPGPHGNLPYQMLPQH